MLLKVNVLNTFYLDDFHPEKCKLKYIINEMKFICSFKALIYSGVINEKIIFFKVNEEKE